MKQLTAAQQKLVTDHLSTAVYIASRMAKRGMPYDDCYASALAGLCEAAARWNPRKAGSASFATFASHRARGKVLDDLREMDYLTRRHRQDEPGHRVDSLSRKIKYKDGEQQDVGDVLCAPQVAVDDGGFDSILAHLPDREHRVAFTLYYAEGMSMREVGLAIGVCESRISQMISGALPLLRAKLTPASECRQSCACPDAPCIPRSATQNRPSRRPAPKPPGRRG